MTVLMAWLELAAVPGLVVAYVTRRSWTKWLRKRRDEFRYRKLPCVICGASPNRSDHPCRVTVTVTKTSHRARYWRWGARPSSRRNFYVRYHARLSDDQKRLLTCDHWHHSAQAAQTCGQDMLRALQTGTAGGAFLTSVRRQRRRVGVPQSKGRGPISGLTPLAWLGVLIACDYRCTYCGEQNEAKDLERDHAIPYARGGPHHASNIVPSCRRCNREKGTLTDDQYRKLRADREAYRPDPGDTRGPRTRP